MTEKSRRRFESVALRVVVLFLSLTAQAPAPARVQDSPAWVGKRVVPRSADFVLRMDDEPVEPSRKAIAIYRVERSDDGPWLWLQAEGLRLRGEARATEVIPVESALEFFAEQIHARPGNAYLHLMRACVLRDRGRLDAALSDYDAAIQLDPTSPIAFCKRGDARATAKEFDKAIADYTAAIRLDPRNAPAYVGRGDVRAQSRDFDRAIEDYSEAIWLDPLAITAYSHRGRAWHAKKEYEKAVVDLNLVIRLDPEDRSAYLNRALAWTALKAYGKAIADCDEAVRIAPDDPEAHGHLAGIYATCPNARYRDGAKAVASATKACTLTGWKDPSSLATLAAASAEAGDFEAAMQWQTRANALFSGDRDRSDGVARLDLYRAKQPYHAPNP